MEPKFDVFISHSTKDKKFADPLWKALEKRGHSCWIAPHSIQPSEKWPVAIRRGISESKIILLLVSANSEASSEVLTELHLAVKFKVSITPIRLENVDSRNLYHYIWNVQDIDTTESPFIEQIESIVGEISLFLGKTSKQKVMVSRPARIDVAIPTDEEIKAEIASPAVKRESNSALQSALIAKGQGRENKIYAAIRDGDTDVEAVDRYGQTALHYIARAKIKLKPDPEQMGVLRLLLPLKPNLNAVNIEGTSPLHLAAQRDNVDAARLLLLRGAKANLKNNKGETALDLARESLSTNTIHLLELFQKPSAAKANAALRAAFDRHSHKSDKILDAVAAGADDYSMVDAVGRTPLHWAAQENEIELVQRLLKKGADVFATDKSGNTPAKLARNRGCIEIEEMLTKWGSNAANDGLQAALASRSRSKYDQMMNALVDGATDFSFTDQAGRSVLHWAVMKDDLEAVKHLLARGADVNITSNAGDTPLALATVSGSKRIINLLAKNGAK